MTLPVWKPTRGRKICLSNGASSGGAEFLGPPAIDRLSGDSPLYIDLNPGNILVNEAAHLVDWAWPARGAAWIDPACLALWLIAGHTPKGAEILAQQIPSWSTATDAATDAYTLANGRLWEQIAEDDPRPWKQRMAAAATRWHRYRCPSTPD